MILGDFNVGNIYLKPEFTNNSGITSFDVLFKDTMDGLGLKQLISEPTRISETAANLRDLILVSGQQNIANCGCLSPFSQIDHIPTYVSLKYTTRSDKSHVKIVWNYHKTNIDKLIHIFEHKDWHEIIDMGIDEAVRYLTKFILDAASCCIPKRKTYIMDKDKPWVNTTIKTEMQRRNTLCSR